MTTILIALALLALLVAVFLPRAGLWSRWREARRLAARCRREDSLKHILKCEADGQTATAESLAGVLGVRPNEAAELLAGMEAHGLISYEEGRLRLQPAGRDLGLHIIRAHRLWESYLAERTGVSEAEWHLRAEKQEHLLSRQQANALAAQLGHPARDPHGDVIPAEDGEFKADTGRPLNSVPLDTPVVISHIEDEPETIYA